MGLEKNRQVARKAGDICRVYEWVYVLLLFKSSYRRQLALGCAALVVVAGKGSCGMCLLR
jgi:hypothetical protein